MEVFGVEAWDYLWGDEAKKALRELLRLDRISRVASPSFPGFLAARDLIRCFHHTRLPLVGGVFDFFFCPSSASCVNFFARRIQNKGLFEIQEESEAW